jgi:predicted dehydrogenase
MYEYLRLLSEGKIDIKPILEREYDIADAPRAYQELSTAPEKPLGILLAYGPGPEKRATKMALQTFKQSSKINVAVVGAGGFAKSTHLPNLRALAKLYHLRAVVSATGSNAKATAVQFGAEYAATDYGDVLADGDVDMVLICTRHHLHAPMAIQAAQAGKAVFVEKPMALNQSELDRLVAVLQETQVPFMVGFNRRFSPIARRAKEILNGRQSPLMVLYRVNAEYIPPGHWTQTEEGGGRIIGEGCHMLDLFQYLVEPARIAEMTCTGIASQVDHVSQADNTVAILRYEDGSVATLVYTALGALGLPKEYVEIYADGKVLVIDDFGSLQVHGAPVAGLQPQPQNKGHLEELQAFARCVSGETTAPIPLHALVETTRISLAIAGQEKGSSL